MQLLQVTTPRKKFREQQRKLVDKEIKANTRLGKIIWDYILTNFRKLARCDEIAVSITEMHFQKITESDSSSLR